MPTNHILIDSNIWYFAYIIPKDEEFAEIHHRAARFLAEKLGDINIVIGISLYQVAEILELLRKGSLPGNIRQDILESFKTPKFRIADLHLELIESAFTKSAASGIHLYDYLTAPPLAGTVTEIYSADDHFQHSDFTSLAQVTNPLSPWILREGRLPSKTE